MTNYYQQNRRKMLDYCKHYQKYTPKGVYNRYKTIARFKEISFELSYDEFLSFWKDSCHYCGTPLETTGLDRIDSNDGYNIWNCVPCCTRCNTIKMDYTVKEFIEHCQKIIG